MNQQIEEITMNNDKVKKILKFERVDPTGVILESSTLEYHVNAIDGDMRTERFVLQIGECTYFVNKKGYIIDRIVPHSDNEPKFCQHEWDEGFHNVHKCKKCGKFNC